MPTRAPEITFRSDRGRVPAILYDVPHWYACYTRSRHEKIVDELLRQHKIESFLPVIVRESLWKDRKKLVSFPLFPGYVFARFTLDHLSQVLATHGVVAVVSARGYPTPIPAVEIESVQLVSRAAGTAAELEPAPMLQEGRWVRVSAGVLEGAVGVVVERRGRQRVLVGISAIGRGVEVDIRVADLVPIAAPL